MTKLHKLFQNRILVAILFVAILTRVGAALYLGDEVIVLPAIHDQVSYDALAQSLLEGRGYSFTENWYPFTPADTPTAHWSFIYPLYLAGTYLVTGYHPLVPRILQAIIAGAATCLLIYNIGRRTVGQTAALIGAGWAAVYIYFIYYNAALMTESFFIVVFLLTIKLGLDLREQPTLKNWLLLGITFGLGTLLRQAFLLLLPFMFLWLLWELRSRAKLWHMAVSAILVVLFIVPWTIRNYNVYNEFLPLNSNAGYAFFASTHPGLGTDWRNDIVVVPVPEQYRGMNEAQLNKVLTSEAISNVLADPVRYGLLTLDKTLEYYKFWPSSESGRISNISRVLSMGIFFPFMIWGIILSLPRWRKLLPLYLFVVLHTGIHLLSWPAPRYRLPVDAVLMPLAGLAVLELVRWLLAKRQLKVSQVPLGDS